MDILHQLLDYVTQTFFPEVITSLLLHGHTCSSQSDVLKVYMYIVLAYTCMILCIPPVMSMFRYRYVYVSCAVFSVSIEAPKLTLLTCIFNTFSWLEVCDWIKIIMLVDN